MTGPGNHGAIGMAVERPVVQALRLQEDDRVVVLDGGDQQTLRVVGSGRHDGLQAAHVREECFRALAVRLPAVDATATRHAHRHWRRELGPRPVPQSGRFREQLIQTRVHVVGDLDLGNGPQPVCPHADRHTDDAALGDRCIEHAMAAVLLLQTFCAAKDAPEVPDVLAENNHVVITIQHHVQRRSQRDVHGHRGHVDDFIWWSCWRRCSGITANTSSKIDFELASRPSSNVPWLSASSAATFTSVSISSSRAVCC